tara:strand:+ start:1016 stop:2959 length:1944 start_codon:yes stop_codon:yes gene_type:complete
MPKIPLTQPNQQNLKIQPNVLLDDRPTIAANVGRANQEDKIFSDMFKLGEGFLEMRIREEEKTYNNMEEVFFDDVDADVEDLYQKGADASLTPLETDEQLIKPYLDTTWNNWLKDNKLNFTADRQTKWNNKKRQLNILSKAKNQEYNNSVVLESELSVAGNSMKNGNIVEGAVTIYSSAHLNDEQKIDEVNKTLISTYTTRLQGASSALIERLETEINNLDSITIPASETETVDSQGNAITLKSKERKHLIDDSTKDSLISAVLKAKKENYSAVTTPLVKEATTAINNGDFSMLQKNQDGDYTNPAIQNLSEIDKQALEALAKMERNSFYTSKADSIASVAAESDKDEILSIGEINELILSLEKISPEDIQETHQKIMNALTAYPIDERSKTPLFPKWFIYENNKIISQVLAERLNLTNSIDPTTENGQYLTGISKFNKTFNRLYGELPQSEYMNMMTTVYTNFYKDFKEQLKKARSNGEDIDKFTDNYINNKLEYALAEESQENFRKRITAESQNEAIFGSSDETAIKNAMPSPPNFINQDKVTKDNSAEQKQAQTMVDEFNEKQASEAEEEANKKREEELRVIGSKNGKEVKIYKGSMQIKYTSRGSRSSGIYVKKGDFYIKDGSLYVADKDNLTKLNQFTKQEL